MVLDWAKYRQYRKTVAIMSNMIRNNKTMRMRGSQSKLEKSTKKLNTSKAIDSKLISRERPFL